MFLFPLVVKMIREKIVVYIKCDLTGLAKGGPFWDNGFFGFLFLFFHLTDSET